MGRATVAHKEWEMLGIKEIAALTSFTDAHCGTLKKCTGRVPQLVDSHPKLAAFMH
jgi:hypothetical protein